MIRTIAEAKEYLVNNFDEGTTCPCCNQIVKLNTYKMSFGHAKVMIEMYKMHANGAEWIHVNSEIKPQGRQFSEAKHWYLIEPMKGKVEGKRTSGFWRLTESGKRFVLDQIRVQEEIKVFKDRRYQKWETSVKTVNIKEALRNRFNYDELMTGFKPYDNQSSLL